MDSSSNGRRSYKGGSRRVELHNPQIHPLPSLPFPLLSHPLPLSSLSLIPSNSSTYQVVIALLEHAEYLLQMQGFCAVHGKQLNDSF